jgi:hypothetical protein
MQVAASGTVQKERTPGKDEKPEDKEKLDKEFKEKQDKLEEKLKNEKSFANWTYVVSKWTIDPLLKERKDFMQEKKEETPADKKESPETTQKKDAFKPASEFLKLPEAAKSEAKTAEGKSDEK